VNPLVEDDELADGDDRERRQQDDGERRRVGLVEETERSGYDA